MARRAQRIGLTGGIGSGKSTVARLLVQEGATLVDSDAIARELTGPGGRALPALRAAFGDSIVDASGALDRDRMRSMAFADASTRARLESILHPLIGAEAERAASQGDGAVVFDVPLLAESRHWRAKVDRVLVVDCDAETQIERVMRRSNWQRSAIESVIALQASRVARRAVADAVIANQDLSLDALGTEVRGLWQRWCAQ